jgi:hypothetical protein
MMMGGKPHAETPLHRNLPAKTDLFSSNMGGGNTRKQANPESIRVDGVEVMTPVCVLFVLQSELL